MTKKNTAKKSQPAAQSASESHATMMAVDRLLKKDDQLSITQLTDILKNIDASYTAKLPSAIADDRDQQHLECLKRSLQAAVTLEFATIPPYLSALWSIKDDLHPAAKSIREVVQEEMLHMALVCNLLASINGRPKINDAVPAYPGPLPGGVHKGLIVQLSGLTKDRLSDFLWIERPVKDVPIEHPYAHPGDYKTLKNNRLQHDFSLDTTIGEFYDEIHNAFKRIKPKMTPDKQISGPLSWTVARNLSDVKFIVELIQHQGEGSENNPENTKGDLSHYYRFLEIYNEQHYQWNKKKGVLEVVGPMEYPEVWPVAEIPEGGYQQADVSKEVWYYLDQFDTTYTILLNQLEAAWTTGGQAPLLHAYETMFELERYAKPLMQIRTPYGGGQTYGPCFRYKPEQDKNLKIRELRND